MNNKRRSDRPLTQIKSNKTRKMSSSQFVSVVKTNRDDDKLLYDIEGEEEEYSDENSEELEEKFDKKTYVKQVNKNKVETRNIKSANKNINVSQSSSRSRRNKIIEEDEDSEGNFNINNNAVVELLPCREKEQEVIYNYIKKGLETNGSYTGLYISGMPGTGKTACVTTVLNKLRKEAKSGQVTPFTVCEINGMKVTNPNNVFKYIYEHIFTDGRSTNLKKCTAILDNFFKNRKDFDHKTQLREYSNPHIVLLIDEIDCLINKKQMLLYNIFNWTTYPNSKIIIISISNTLDLPEKLLPKISSRIGNNRLSFKPYQKDELVKILSVKIDNFELFSEDAIKLSSMKVAAVNGDLRRILQICRRAKEIFDSEIHKPNDKIDKSQILRATEDLFDSKMQSVIQSLNLYEKMTLAAILFQMKIQTNTKVGVVPIYDRLKYFFLRTYGRQCYISFEDYTMMIYNLVKLQIINFSDGFSNNFINHTVGIKFHADEFTVAMEKDENLKEILKELA